MEQETSSSLVDLVAGQPVDLRQLGDARSIDEEHGLLGVAREHHRLGTDELGPILLRHADVAALLHDPAFEQLGLGLLEFNGVIDGPLYEWWSQIMFANEGERHRRLRKAVRVWLTPKRVADLAGPVESATREILAGLSVGEEFDLADRVANPIPIMAISALLGVDTDQVAELGNATTDIGMAFGFFGADGRRRIEAAVAVLLDWGEEALRCTRPGTLARSIAQADGAGELEHVEAVALIANLLFAAHDTTRFLLANAFWELGRNPEVWDRLAAGAITAADVVEETLRFQPPAIGTIRIARAQTHVGGLDVAPGDLVGASLWSAARDPRVYDNPDVFDPVPRHTPLLSFGHGVHYCIGASLARLEARVVLDTVVSMCPNLSISSDRARSRPDGAAITGIDHLPARLS
jgi:cytochrome P450